MSKLKTEIYSKGDRLPQMESRNFFHSETLFHVVERTPRQRPYMVVVRDADGSVAAHLLAVLRYRSSWFPPYLYAHCRIYGEGEYADGNEARGLKNNVLLGMMVDALTRRLQRWVLYVELSNLKTKMFGYRELRGLDYFSVRWMSIHNSLHSRTPEERIDERMKQHIAHARQRGAVTKEVETEEEFGQAMRLLRHHHWLKPKRYIPHQEFFRQLWNNRQGRLFVTKSHEKVIGCCVCAYSEGDAYLWYSAFRRKSYVRLHPDVLTVWHAIGHAYEQGFRHMRFMDVGLPYGRNPFREFVLSFGGKPVSTYRWFRCNISVVNRVLKWIYHN